MGFGILRTTNELTYAPVDKEEVMHSTFVESRERWESMGVLALGTLGLGLAVAMRFLG